MTRTLVLIPTAAERDVLQPLLEPQLTTADRVELCGFGLVAAAALTSQFLQKLTPERVLLVGIAGTYVDRLPAGSAAVFDEVTCQGIGAGSGDDHQTAGDMGWNHIGGRVSAAGTEGTVVADSISLRVHDRSGDDWPGIQDVVSEMFSLLSVASASGSADDADRNRRRFPDAAAEDMEGFAVALACQLTGTPLTIVRGISNRAGDRCLDNWQIHPALQAAGEVAARLL